MNTLESYVAAVLDQYLLEDLTASSDQFDIEALKHIQKLPQVLGYVKRTLKNNKIGQGQGRTVYRLPGGRVLKVATNPGGLSQNETEATVCKSEQNADIFPKTFEIGPQAMWLVAEEAKPMTRVGFSQLTGLSWSDFLSALGGAFPNSLNSRISQGQITQFQQAFDKHYANQFFRRVISLIKDCKYEPGDIAKIDSWGIVNGKPVIIDSGFTEAVNKAHYKGKS